jgi:hypothetical protein
VTINGLAHDAETQMIPGIWPGLYLFHRNHGEALKKTPRRLYSLPEQCGARVSGCVYAVVHLTSYLF